MEDTETKVIWKHMIILLIENKLIIFALGNLHYKSFWFKFFSWDLITYDHVHADVYYSYG